VFDAVSGLPIANAEVIDLGTGDKALTSETGTSSLWFIADSAAMVEVRKLGYEPWSSMVDLRDTTPVTVVLNRAAELSPVVVNAAPNIARDPGLRSGFELRCQAANVGCVRDDAIASHPTNTLGDLLLRTPGVLAVNGRLTMHGSSGGLCTPTYFVDGIEWNSRTMGVPIDQPGAPPGESGTSMRSAPSPPFNTSNVEKVEVYPAEGVRPLRFSGDAACGVIAIWTR
jgi:hypothetical protein